jgi:DNA-binding response OmpR family regulator
MHDEKPLILLAEDEESLAIGLEYNLNEEGYGVIRATDGEQAVERFDPGTIDLVILDIMMPKIDGFTVAELIREKSPRIPIMMLTARSAPADRIRGLEIGADDYLVKPFHLEELLLRVKGMLRRKSWYEHNYTDEESFTFSGIEIDFGLLKARIGEQEVKITPLEGYAAQVFYLESLEDHFAERAPRKSVAINLGSRNQNSRQLYPPIA